jgi:hypothetical protein
LYQQLLQHYAKTNNTNGLADTDMDRIEFVHNNSTHPNKEQLYENALLKLEQLYQSTPVLPLAMSKRVQLYVANGNKYAPFNPLKTAYQFELAKAKVLAEEIVQKYPKTEGAAIANNLLMGINQKTLSFRVENVNLPNEPFRALVSFKNIQKPL